MFHKVLVANRGEIAQRIIASAKSLGYRTVAVYSEPDCDAPHVQLADEAVCLGKGVASDSYLNIEKILHAARITRSDAIHPGYGFLSENSDFAQACSEHGLVFIGPDSKAIRLMGSKRAAKEAMLAAKVPCVPGYEGKDQSNTALTDAAEGIGYPIMVKASAGGGGRGMRVVKDSSELESAIKSARSEAFSAFGSDELILEKALTSVRHIEIQIFADTHGNTIHLGERDCSMQRRHQKVIEEAPSPALTPELRESMGQAAISAAKACNYVGAGTVEFLLTAEHDFYFLEMNTRLQVEHPVTELVTNLDLVEWQLRVAAGEKLPLKQDQIKTNGHAIEVRLYAEDPANSFMPQTGTVSLWRPALTDSVSGKDYPGLRVDSGIYEGSQISAHYDPMLAKFIAYGENREQARRRLLRLVQDSHLLGLRDNRSFLSELLQSDTFVSGQATTDFIRDQFTNNPSLASQVIMPDEWGIAALLLCEGALIKHSNLQTTQFIERPIKICCGNYLRTLKISYQNTNKYRLSFENKDPDDSGQSAITIELVDCKDNQLRYIAHAGEKNSVMKTSTFTINRNGDISELWLASNRGNLLFADQTFMVTKNSTTGSNKILASMDGVVVDLLVEKGQTVKCGDVLTVIEAMKMEHPLKAGMDGIVGNILTSPGEQVKGRQLLIELQE
ncbi:acetyl/propionyl/methylcrotonyl-CoA carboxylase subunit alpha [Endozoicomonas elysicola]|uniref:Biotin carboxylase n=1 Tax=Endozoicomonas elysicola TaxID=305900 RepID=A0A081KF32_9GAMM|nr:acetyl-CoA carboxylase biotin carboxylase subunit [Endozoicomonas elysicola]KEI72758.1 3-methylcrotonyl-CoA carboxylase [Endozoicomonas elysicola]